MTLYKGELSGFPTEVVEKMLERQVEQGNEKNVSVFELVSNRGKCNGGFDWDSTREGKPFWKEVIDLKNLKNFDLFFEKYPKTLKVGDEVIICGFNLEVRKDSNYYLDNRGNFNSEPFTKLNLDKRKTSLLVLGHYNGGGFPECHTLEDLTKLVNYLKEVEMKQDVDLSKGWIVECGTSEKVNIVKDYLSFKYTNRKSVGTYSSYKYVIDNGSYGSNIYNYIPEHYKELPILTFKQFETLILNKQTNKQNEKNRIIETDTNSKRGTSISLPSRKGQTAIGFRYIGNKVTARIQKTTINSVKISRRIIST